jgi:transketolase
VLSRQTLPVLEGTDDHANVARGAYVLSETGGTDGVDPDVILIGTGSEVSLCLDAAALLAEAGTRVRVVSMPCWELFDEQTGLFQEDVLPSAVPTLAVEAGASFGWDRWADDSVTIDRFGASAPAKVVFEKLGLNPQNVAQRAQDLLADLSPDLD